MSHSSTVEDYLKRLWQAQEALAPAEPVSMGRIARDLDVTPGTATSMMKHLAAQGLVDYVPRAGVRLTAEGRRGAIKVLRRHRLIEHFLVSVLGLDWSEIHSEAERLEHAVSDRVLDALDAHLGFPERDPHGDPIPSASGEIVADALIPLAEAPIGQPLEVARVLDQRGAFLRYLDERGLTVQATLAVRSRDAAAEVVEVVVAGGTVTAMGVQPARKILVRKGRESAVKVAPGAERAPA